NVVDIDHYYRKSEIFAFPSLSEGFPNALAEGMKASLACIAYDCVAGPSELIEDGKNGFLVPVGKKNFFKKRLKELMINEKKRERFQNVAAPSIEKLNKEFVLENLKQELIK
ncbi:MAG TPA: glycosyltransferase, partial [Bacteroidales bacterium]|nr:glycosyltransferase [Bacteroidales bacterium]